MNGNTTYNITYFKNGGIEEIEESFEKSTSSVGSITRCWGDRFFTRPISGEDASINPAKEKEAGYVELSPPIRAIFDAKNRKGVEVLRRKGLGYTLRDMN
jgi:hypothetical protein